MPIEQIPVYQSWSDIIIGALQAVWFDFATFLPTIIAAIVVFIIGWFIAVSLGRIIHELIKASRLDHVLSKLGVQGPLQRAGLRLDVGLFMGGIVKWFIILAFLLATTDILGLNQVSGLLSKVLSYIPDVLVAAIILLAAVLIANFTQKIVTSSVNAAGLASGTLLGAIARWTVIIFAIFAALDQLKIAQGPASILSTGIVAMLALAGGLAFGLGGKDHASAFIARLKEEMSERR